MKKILSFLFVILCLSANAQFVDDFSDGDLTNNPEWIGDVSKFTVVSGELRLNDLGESASSYLSAYAPTKDSSNWEFYVRLDFAPSTSNYTKIYLTSSASDLGGTLNGYYIRIGESGSNDALKLYRQTGTSSSLLITGTAAAVGAAPAIARVKVTRSSAGDWEMYADYTGGTNYTLEGTANDDTHSTGNFTGVWCRYTSTRGDEFFFDDFRIDPLLDDTTPPTLLSVEAIDGENIDVRFDEPVSSATAENASNYSLTDGVSVNAAMLDDADPTLVHLSLGTSMTSGVTYTLEVSNVQDLGGNPIAMATQNFTYFESEPVSANDIIINEIFADPSPKLGMPSAEFIELYNRSEKIINLRELSFSTGSTPQTLPNRLLFPNEYIIICDLDDETDFSVFGDVAAIASFPAITNNGDDLLLSNTAGDVIDVVSFTTEWYKDTAKSDGGWSLELINPSSPCEAFSNWTATNDLNGGTPGNPNSVLNESEEEVLPGIFRALVLSPTQIQVIFTQSVNPSTATDLSNYTVDNGVTLASASIVAPANDKVNLTLTAPLTEATIYTITGSSNILNCTGLALGLDDSAQFGLTEAPEAGDVIINEILFNQQSGGADYVELYNRSNKIINIADLGIARLTEDEQIGEIDVDYFLFPGSYVVLTENVRVIRSGYNVANNDALIQIKDLTTLPSDEGNITIYAGINPSLNVIDAFDYDEDMHYALLDNVKGVALERIDFNGETQSRDNWQSAAANVGFGTPTAPNSQAFENLGGNGATISFAKKTFSPDGDGTDDVLLMNYEVAGTGYSANISIYDANGRLVKSLVRNELLANTGTYKWDGVTDSNEKARIGIYVVFVELYDAEGNLETYKETVVVAGILE